METVQEANLVLVQCLYAGVLFAVGACVGSFINVVAYRVPLGLSVMEPPSACPKCGARIASRDNLPVLGWMLLRGKCRACRAPISVRYPLVEFATGLLWAVAGWRLATLAHGHWTNVGIGLLHLAFVSAMVATILIDIDYFIILDEISIGGTVVALVASFLLPVLHHAAEPLDFAARHPLLYQAVGEYGPGARGLTASVVGLLTGLAFSMGIYFLGNVMFRKQIKAAKKEDPDVDSALGLGDVKLMACFGAFLGWKSVLFIFIVGSILGAVVGVAMKIRTGDPEGAGGMKGLLNRWQNGASVIPFGPFLAAGALLYLFFGPDILASQVFFPTDF